MTNISQGTVSYFELKRWKKLGIWEILHQKMSECLRTYGPQIIRVPQLQIED